MTEQEFRDSCVKFDIKVGNFMGDYLLCQWNDITLGHYNKNSGLAVITNIFINNKMNIIIMGNSYNLVNADIEHNTNFLHNDKMEERFAYLIKIYKQEIINERLKNLENDYKYI